MRRPSIWAPAFTVGVPTAMLSSLPSLCGGDCCCVVFLLVGGLLAASLYRSACMRVERAFTPQDGATVGLATGVVHVAVFFVVSLFWYLFGATIATLVPLERLVEDLEGARLAEWSVESLLGYGLGGFAALVQGACAGAIIVPFHVASGLLAGALFPYDPPSTPAVLDA